MSQNTVTSTTKQQKISTQLLVILVPMIALFIIVAAVTIYVNARSVIISKGKNLLQQESIANANDIGSTIENIKGYYNGLSDALEVSDSKSDTALMNALSTGMAEYPDVVSDVYVAFSDKSFYDGSGWVPDKDYDPTTRAWYQNGISNSAMTLGEPSLDLTTGQMVVCGSRSINMKGGRKGVLSTDIALSGISNSVSAYSPAGSGTSMLLSQSSIVASPTDDYVGTDVTEHENDAFLQSIYNTSKSNTSGDVQTIRGNNGEEYFVSFDHVPGTDWILISYIMKNDLLRELRSLSVFTVILVIVMLIISTLIIFYLINRMITSPVTNLTDTITKIADGNFTVNIDRSGNNEIGTMNNRMHEYVEQMRGTLGEMKKVTQNLSIEADSSKNAAESMSIQADEQSQSMSQIHVAMEEVANSVTELASNATDLARAVDEVTEHGSTTKSIMNTLLEKAKKGQQDMSNVQNNMTTISNSMSEMSTVVQSVGEAAKKINSIVELINSISSQTNLLSLNASIEAARAGEAGKGFAVVATEIGTLANDSATAATEISEIIKDITNQITSLSERSEVSVRDIAVSCQAVSITGETFTDIFVALDQAGSTVNDMVTKMDKVNSIAASVAAIAEEQSASTEEVTATVETAANSARHVADESRNVDSSAITVAESSAKIEKFVDMFTI